MGLLLVSETPELLKIGRSVGLSEQSPGGTMPQFLWSNIKETCFGDNLSEVQE